MPSLLDPGQITKLTCDEPNQAVRVIGIAGSLVTEIYDEIDLTYVAAGNGVGEIETATYKLAGSTIATLALTYDSSNRITTVVRS